MYLLNIGLNNLPAAAGVSIGRKALFAARALRAVGFSSRGAQVVNSDTEPTLVASVYASRDMAKVTNGQAVKEAVFRLAEALNQECIALYLPIADKGELIGPQADKWGAFNLAYFFNLDGSSMGETV